MQVKIVTGSTGDIDQGSLTLQRVRVGGTANLAGIVQVKKGSTVIDSLPVATVPGTERIYHPGLHFGHLAADKLNINLANAADTVLVFFD